jgi:hypothetical protein
VDFKLLYSGQLHAAASGNPRTAEKHLIRKELHKQLRQLWETHPLLAKMRDSKVSTPNSPPGVYVNRLEAIADRYARCGYRFVPVVSRDLSLSCAVDALFLRRDHPGNLVRSGGDIDNRLKTLFDALRMPNNCDELAGNSPDADENPFFVLLEDDALITKISVTTDRLLLPQTGIERINDVRLVIGVSVNVVAVTYSHGSNAMFLGS